MYSRLRELRVDNDLSQEYVAKYLKMSQTGYSKYETGENSPPVQVIVQLANLYRTSADYLLNMTNETKPYR